MALYSRSAPQSSGKPLSVASPWSSNWNSFPLQSSFEDFEFVDQGEVALQGFDEPVRAWSVEWSAR